MWSRDSQLDVDRLVDRLAIAENALAEKTRSVALTSHELRTPLNGVLGMADLLMKTQLSPEQTSYVRAIDSSAKALLTLVDNMLDAGKIAAGYWHLDERSVSLEPLIEEVVELLAPRAQKKGLELAAHVSRQLPASVRVDPDQLTRILMNLTGNAIKFTEKGGVAIDVTSTQRDAEFARILICVRDTGIGIASADQTRIFGEYEQASTGSSPHPGGTGLGLAISRAMARAMGGDISLESVPGHGSVFTLSLELPVVLPTQTLQQPFLSRHLLLISDKMIEPPVLMRRLFDLGASVELVCSLEAAHKRLSEPGQFDAILFDHGDALDIAAFMDHAAEPLPPVAVLVAPAERSGLDQWRQRGIRAHLVKPIRTQSLIKVGVALLAGQSLSSRSEPTPAKVRETVDRKKEQALRILLVDDNEINVLLGTTVLQSLGYGCETASDGIKAIAMVQEANASASPFDIILMDLHMPDVDGFEATRAIRDMEQTGLHRSQIIALTADSTPDTSRRALEAGADHTLVKPFGQAELRDILERFAPREVARDA